MWVGVGDRTELQHIDPHSIGHYNVSFPFSWAAQPGAWGPTLLGVGFLYRIISPTYLISKLTDVLYSPGLYNNLTSTLLPTSVTISHSFNPSTVNVIISWFFLDRMHLLFTHMHFLFWQPGRVGGQYTTEPSCLKHMDSTLSTFM